MMEQLVVFYHRFGIEDRVQRRFDLVFQGKAVPSDLPVRVLQYPCVETAENVGRIVLRIRASNGRLEVGSQVMSVEADRGLGKSWTDISCHRREPFHSR